MKIKNKIFIGTTIFLVSMQGVFADNKSDILNQIATVQSSINNVQSSQTNSLENIVTNLSKKYDNVYTSFGYSSSEVNYLVTLGKLPANYKSDLIKEYTDLKSYISSKAGDELNSLSTIKDNVNFNYTTVSDTQKAALLSSISDIDTTNNNLQSDVIGKISALNTKYTNNLSSYTTALQNAVLSNSGSIKTLSNFAKTYDNLFAVVTSLNANYQSFKTSYLAYGSDLSSFSQERQTYYVNLLKTELEKIRDLNIQGNPTLVTYQSDIDRMIDLLLENFQNSLKLQIDDSYGLVFSDNDITSVLAKYDTLKNKYYGSDGNIIASNVLANSGATAEIADVYGKLSDINTKIVNLLGTGGTVNTYSNVKIRLENEMVKYYNANYEGYRQDLLLKLKEKLNIVSLEAKNVILAADAIDLRYTLLNDKLSKSNDVTYINTEIANFKQDLANYSYLNSDIINKKIATLENNLETFAVKKELALFKYNKMPTTKYDAELANIFNKLKTQFPDDYVTKLNTVLVKVNDLLNNTKLSDTTRFMLLKVKINILNYIK